MNREASFPVSGILLDEGSMETGHPRSTPYAASCISIPALCWNVAGALFRRPGPSEMLVSPSQPPPGEKEGKMGSHSRGTSHARKGVLVLILVLSAGLLVR
jgi:hypothetical protein